MGPEGPGPLFMTLFRGLSAFPITPADAQGQVNTLALRSLLDRLVEADVDSIGLLGSTGSYAYLSRFERRRAVDAAIDQVAGRLPVMVGIGALRTDDAIAFGQDARDAGADALLLAPMSYIPLTDDEVFEHFKAVARATDLPLCIYDNPAATHFSFKPSLVGRLAQIPTIVALKSPAPGADAVIRHLEESRAVTYPGFSSGYSVDRHAMEAMLGGGDAWYSVLGGLFPEPCMQILRAVHAGEAAQARLLNARLEPLWSLFTEFSSLRVVHAAASLLGLCKGMPPRPILPLPDEARQRIGEALDLLGLV